jgi:alpha-ketoglutarate-dependent taurine dioxygenase
VSLQATSLTQHVGADITGLTAEALVELLAWATRPEFVPRHQWRSGDLVMWDNTGMLHRAMEFEPTSRRLLHRTTLVGTAAVA